ncbi:short-chain dehydrogenase/reductase SDR [Parafrankia sp. EAN1pec]|uniref:SDR family NAD(P)-dependent oxidoreductase n=1 Tax=Parafrankia sp. (strain EAN1pec) TaxID=298653 RepID=UPI00005431BD|nr:short-chain dehydrogenase/reductase SDR [Frankia sp. EAN1pec]
METGLNGRTVLITGGSANIGRGIALAFAAEGSNVVVVGRDEAQGRRVCDAVLERGAGQVLWWAAAVTDRAQVGAMVAATHERFGALDVLVNNAGGNAEFAEFVNSDPTVWEKDISLNIASTLNCTHAALPGMIERGCGRVINIGSTSAILGDPLMAVYSAMKGAVHAFTRVLAREVGKQGITVNAIAPYATMPLDYEQEVNSGSRWHPDGIVARLAATRSTEELRLMSRRTVLDRQFAFPAEIGAAAVYLASDGAAFVTGQVLAVDGGTQLA